MAFVFDGNGATGGAVPEPVFWMDPDGTVVMPDNVNNLTRVGYTFVGWAGNKNATNPDFGIPGSNYTIDAIENTGSIRAILEVIEDMDYGGWVLYAVWEPVPPVTLTYNGNDATSGSAPVDSSSPYPNGATVIVLEQDSLTKSGSIFLGWATTSNASLAQYAKDSQFVITSDTVLYAVWGSPSTPLYTVTYNGNGATSGNAPVDSNSYSQGVLATVKTNTGGLVRVGYRFLGWHTNSVASTPVFKVIDTTTVSPLGFNIPSSNVVLFAVWEEIQYCTVTYGVGSSDGGVAPVDPNSPYEKGSTVVVLERGTLTRLYSAFLGWVCPGSYVTYYEGAEFIIDEDIVLLPLWDSIPPIFSMYPVVYNGNGATGGNVPLDGNYPGGVSVTVLGNTGGLVKAGCTFLGWATKVNANVPDRMPGSTFTMPHNSVTLYAVWGSGGGGGGGTVVVPYNGRYAGSGSKQSPASYNGASPIMQIATNLPNNTDSSAVIENLIIDGLNLSNNATGILLEDVCGCLVRNVTIMNCEVGIKVKLSGGNGGFSRDNRFEHIRMINVKTGILFEGTSSAKDFSYTTIEDVGISLAGNSSDVGIKVGTNSTNANLYSAFVKTNVWLNGSNGAGLIVNGQLKGSLVNLAVAESTPSNSGKCIVLNSGAYISDNQSFLSTSLQVASNIVNNKGTHSGIKTVP